MQNISYGEFNKINSISFTSEYGKLKNIKLEGSTSQATRSGKNLLNVTAKTTTVQGITFTVNADKSITINGTNTGTGTAFFRLAANFVLPAADYTLSNKNANASAYGFLFYDDGNNFPRKNISNATFTEDTTIKPYIRIDAGVTINNQTIYPMIIKRTYTEETIPAYEQYGASPSPDYPSEIENIEGKNKFDINQEKEIFNIMVYKYSYYLKPNTKYTISSNCPASTTANIYANSDSSKCIVYINKNQTIQSDENGYFYILVRFKADRSDNSTFNLYEKVLNGTYYIQLEEGTVATDYVPYNSLEIKDIGENLLDLSKCQFNNCKIGSDGKSIISNISNGYYCELITTQFNDYLLANKGKTLTFLTGTLLNKATAVVIYGTRTNGSSYQEVNEQATGKCSITVADDFTTITAVRLRFNRQSTPFTDTSTTINYAMLVLGTEEITYKPYQEQKVDFPLSEGQKLYKDSYLSSDGIHHRRKQVVLDGTETVNFSTGRTKTFSIGISTRSSSGICTHYKQINSAQFDTKTGMYLAYSNSFIVSDPRFSTIEEFKAYLAEQYASGTPVTFEYIMVEKDLKTPHEEIIPYTEAQQEVWDKIENFPIFIGQNNLTSTALLSAIYIKKITTDTKVDYNLYNENYINIATKNNIHPKFKIQMLDEYENVIDEVTGDISRDNSGSISNNYQQGVRRSISLTFIDTEGKFLPDSNSNLIWANKKFKLFSGLLDTDTNEVFWFSEGVYYFSNVSSSRNGADKLTTVNGVDKFGKFGSELGYNQFESTYLIPAGTKIYDAIKKILNIDIGNGYPIDPIEPILDPLYIDEVCLYDISKSPSSYLSEMLIELADIIGCDIYYDADGRLHVDSGTIDFSYSNRPSIWDFSDVLPEYMNPSITTNFAEFINTVKVVGNNTNDKIYEYTAVNNNPESPTRVDLIGTKSTYIESASVYNTDRAKNYAEYKLNMFSILQLAVTFSCTFLPHLDVNKVITITDSYYKYEKQRFVIQSITLPLSYDGVMSISACNVASLPYYEGGN